MTASRGNSPPAGRRSPTGNAGQQQTRTTSNASECLLHMSLYYEFSDASLTIYDRCSLCSRILQITQSHRLTQLMFQAAT